MPWIRFFGKPSTLLATEVERVFIRTIGQGPDLVLVHGWAMHSGIWEEFAADLAGEFRVTLLDLPGHGRSAMGRGAYSLDNLVQALRPCAPPGALWCGWSLGAQVCLHMAQTAPERVGGVIAIAGTPRFLSGPAWAPGLRPEVFEQFSTDLIADYKTSVRRFLALQVRGSHAAGEVLRRLRERILSGPEPHPEALVGGLALLKETDMRAGLSRFPKPLLWILGERDTLVPVTVASTVAALVPQARIHVIRGAGHAPFLSHGSVCRQAIVDFTLQMTGAYTSRCLK